MRRLKGDQAKLGYASILIQVANFAVLLLAKAQISASDFVFLLTQLAIAGMIGAIATMRLEILIYQKFAKMTYAAAVMPIAASLAMIAILYLGVDAIAALGFDALSLSALSIPMMLGLGLSIVLSFLVIQVKQINLLLISRACQAMALGLLTAVLAIGASGINGPTVLMYIGICYLVPATCVLVYFLARFTPDGTDPSPLFLPSWSIFQRAVSLTISTGVNSVYTNLPLLIAAATEPAGFVADFGLILRCFTAPVTFIRQVIGQLYMASAIAWSTSPGRTSKNLYRLSVKAMTQSVVLYLMTAPFLVAVLFFNTEALNITHFYIAPYLGLAALGQCAITIISQVRIPLSDEKAFMLFDFARLAGLALALTLLATLIPFEMAFCLTTMSLYTFFLFFIRSRIARYVA